MTTTAPAPFIDRHALVISSVTLDGAPARLIGIRDDYATVIPLRGGAAPVQYAWTRAYDVVTHGGNFAS
jgi:hypothetical protein